MTGKQSCKIMNEAELIISRINDMYLIEFSIDRTLTSNNQEMSTGSFIGEPHSQITSTVVTRAR